jgi:hypothetical protein
MNDYAGQESRALIIHYHIFKNAGTSVDFALSESFGDKWTKFEGKDARDVMTSARMARFIEENPNIKAISSHLARPPLPTPACRAIAFLRHPLLRMRSVYNFVRMDGTQHGNEIANRYSFADYLRWAFDEGRYSGGVVIRNYQVVHLSQASFRSANILTAEATLADVKEAKDLITSWGAIGIVELYSQSCRMFELALKNSFPEFRFNIGWHNKTSGSEKTIDRDLDIMRDELGSDLFDASRLLNDLDLALYDWAKDRARYPCPAIAGSDRDRDRSRLRRTPENRTNP